MTVELLTLIAHLCTTPYWHDDPMECHRVMIKCIEKTPTVESLVMCVKTWRPH